MARRNSKTAAQQCRYYEVDNIFVYMLETYINGNIPVFRELYRELDKDGAEGLYRLPFERGRADLLERNIETNHLKRQR